jgi:hypothetical protein
MPDFSRPGTDGALPKGVPESREGLGELTTRGLIYTSRGARSVIPCDQRYRISAGFKQKVAKAGSFTNYADLYRRVTCLGVTRAAEMSCDHGKPLYSRIVGHAWTCLPGNSYDFVIAALVTELSCSRIAPIEGEAAPTPSALVLPGGTPQDKFSRIASQPSEEFYNEYDTGDHSGTNADPVSFSYGEHVETCSGLDYAPFVDRAENRARFHYSLLTTVSSGAKLPFIIMRRDWWAVPDTLVVVVIYFQA